jgi:thiol-disulfide isomerase/thioredoxin
MKRAVATVLALGAAQALMLGIWYAVERQRADPADEVPPPVAAHRTQPMDAPAPELAVQRADGSALPLSETGGRPLVLHFWATWCPPCRDELPALLAFAAASEVQVLAVSLDPEWGAVRRFLGPDIPPSVVLASGEAVARAFDVRTLPATFVVDAKRRLRLRLDGPRDWASPAARAVALDAARP